MFFDILKAIILGIVQGITEWLPISSTAHLILIEDMLSFNFVSDGFFDVFKVVIQLGSILAVVVIYFKKLMPYRPIEGESYGGGVAKDAKLFAKCVFSDKDTFILWGKIILACIPAAVIGLLIEDYVDSVLSESYVIAAALIIYGLAFIWLENTKKKSSVDTVSRIGPKRAFFIGCFQTLALIPGTSRSGSTILGATLLGTGRAAAAEFSFFLAIPVMFGASALKLLSGAGDFASFEWLLISVGSAVSFIVSVAVIKLFMNFIKKHSFTAFGIYRIILGFVILAIFTYNKLV